MAIHVRPTNLVQRKVASLIRRMLSIALGMALLSIIISALILYISKIYSEKPSSSSFVTYTPPVKQQDKTNKRPVKEDNAVSEPSSASAQPAPIILAENSAFTMDFPSDVDNMADGVAADDAMGFGFGAFGDGLGDGEGFGDGEGSGGGDGGGKGAGYNDDIQVVLLLDASGSMQELFKAASASMEQVLTALSNARLNGKKTKVNVGIVIYGQADKNGAPIKLSPFTTQVRKMRHRLEEVACDGAREECGAAISFAVNNFPWNRRDRDDMLKVIFIAGNESFAQGNIDYHSAIAEATAQHIIVNTIHCGDPDTEWEEAATLGNGIGLTLDMDYASAKEVSPEDLYRTLKGLHDCKPLPIGAPAVQRRHIDMLNNAPAPPERDMAKMQKWLMENKRRILLGYDWDAIEIYRCTPQNEFSISLLGGEGNLPVSLRGQSEEEIMGFLSGEANRRTRLLELYKQQKASGNLGDKILNVLQEQAQEKGISIDY